jgi:hypothetical protein
MNTTDLQNLIRSSLELTNVAQGQRHDAAIKLYAYPAMATLLTDDEFQTAVQPDQITVRRGALDRLRELLAERLRSVVAAMPLAEVYLTAVIYGLVVPGGDNDDLIVQVAKVRGTCTTRVVLTRHP